MKLTTIAASAAIVVAGATAGFAASHAPASTDCDSMLTQSIGLSLNAEGFDTTNICSLSLGELVTIKGILDSDGMNASSRQTIENLLGGS
ncbi:MAG: hypothetical protein AAFR47_01500 [Pseudomonadota bacterium]